MEFENIKALYVGELWNGSTARHRMFALKRHIQNLDSLNSAINRTFVNRLRYYIYKKITNNVLDINSTNKKIIKIAKRAKYDLIWIDKGISIKKSTLHAIRKLNPGVKIIHYSPDDMFNKSNQSKDYLNCIPEYDYHITTKSYNVDELHSMGARDVVFVDNAFEPSVHKNKNATDDKSIKGTVDVGFIGSYEKERYKSILFLAENKIYVQVFGSTWKKVKNIHPYLCVTDKDYWEEDFARIINMTYINLCFLRKENRDLQTTRSIEIPACGGLMLAEKTIEHDRLFKENIEAMFFSNDIELLEKVKFLLANRTIGRKIAESGHNACINNDYSNDQRIRSILLKIQ